MRVVALVPAFRNELSIRETVLALLKDPRIADVLVVDDASKDGTSAEASGAGARVLRLPKNVGKGRAIERGLDELGEVDAILFVDGDTGASASSALSLLEPIVSGAADMAVGVLPSPGRKGGFGTVKRVASVLIRMTSGMIIIAPLSGQRVVRREVIDACRPLADGFGVDAALTADAVSRGFVVVELPVDMTHDHRGRSISGFAHRGKQAWDVVKALTPRLLRRRIR